MTKHFAIRSKGVVLSLAAALFMGAVVPLAAQTTDDGAFYRCQGAFGLIRYDGDGNMYTLSGWRTNATGGATCYYTQYN